MQGSTGATSQLNVQVRFHGGAPGFPLLRTDDVFLKPAEFLVNTEGWETAVIATDAKPIGAVQARIRFIATGITSEGGPEAILIDNVVVTAE